MSSRVFNFSAGPASLPLEVMHNIQKGLLDFADTGCSVMEISHRSSYFFKVYEQLQYLFRQLMNIPQNYQILFLQGGASMQFSMLPTNFLLNAQDTADYAITGHWSNKAYNEATKLFNVNTCCNSAKFNWLDIDDFENWQINPLAKYLHYAINETITGVSFDYIPNTNINLVADASSMILSQPLDISKFALIYACSQKNIAPAGLTVVIVRDSLLNGSAKNIATLLDYKSYAQFDSMPNTPTTFSWYCAYEMLKWLKKNGGVDQIYKINLLKAKKLYDYIDNSNFYQNNVKKRYRSIMNITFYIYNDNKQDINLQNLFVKKSQEEGLFGLKGHKISGGIRASIYNSMPILGVEKLIQFMHSFEKKYL